MRGLQEAFPSSSCGPVTLFQHFSENQFARFLTDQTRLHVFQDLEPYQCTYKECTSAGQTYSSRATWFQHELDMHRREWKCPDCKTMHRTSIAFREHFDSEHHEQYTEQGFLEMVKTCSQEADSNTRSRCPFCLEWCDSLRESKHHIANHFEEAALYTLKDWKLELGEDVSAKSDVCGKDVLELGGIPSRSSTVKRRDNRNDKSTCGCLHDSLKKLSPWWDSSEKPSVIAILAFPESSAELRLKVRRWRDRLSMYRDA